MTGPEKGGGTVTLGDVTLHYEMTGAGPPLLLISGLGQNSAAWGPALPLLARSFRCIRFDNRGTGQSSVPPGPYTIDAMADDAAGLLAQLGIATASVVGWSLGGSVLQSMLIRHGGCLERCVLLNAFPSYTELQHAWLDALIALRRSDAPPLAKAVFGMPWGLTPLTLSDHASTSASARRLLDDPYPTSREGFEAQAAGLRIYDSRPLLPTVRTPCMVLVGAEDVLTPVAQSAEIARLIPHAALNVLGKGGHRMIVEYPEAVTREIVKFVSGGRAAP